MQHPLVRPSLAPYGFAYHQHSDRLSYKPRHDPYYVNAERMMARFWDRRHRIDALDPLPIETIIHRIMPGHAQVNRLFEKEFEFRGYAYMSRDIALLSSIMYWFGTNVGSCFLEVPYTGDWLPKDRQLPPLNEWKDKLKNHPEHEFLKKYERAMRDRDMVAFWGHECTGECGESRRKFSPFVSPHAYDSSAITERDRAVVRGLMHWLGRVEGRSFTADWLAHLKKLRDAADVRRKQETRANVAA